MSVCVCVCVFLCVCVFVCLCVCEVKKNSSLKKNSSYASLYSNEGGSVEIKKNKKLRTKKTSVLRRFYWNTTLMKVD